MAAARHLHAVCALQLVGIEQMTRWCTRAGVALPVDRMLAFNDELDLGAPIDVADVATLRVRACVCARTYCLQALLQVHQLRDDERLRVASAPESVLNRRSRGKENVGRRRKEGRPR